jgi:hypothetical protein
MALETRYYSTPLAEAPDPITGEPINVPAITLEPMLAKGHSTRDDGVVAVAATPEGWAEFDAKYPNQDAQTGEPYQHRHVTSHLPTADFSE